MANFITTSITGFSQEEYDVHLRPMFVGDDIFDTPGIVVDENVRGSKKLNYFSAAVKMVKAYVKGWQTPSSKSTFTQRTLTTVDLKAEAAIDAKVFENTILEALTAKGYDQNNIDMADPALKAVLVENFVRGVKSDRIRLAWLGDTNKETTTGTGTSKVYSGTADTDYNSMDGLWKLLMTNATTTPTTDDHIFRVAFANGAVAQVATITITGTSGTATVAWAGVNYTATFATDLATTALNFKTTHAAAMLLRGVTLTNSGATVILTSTIAGMPFAAPTIANATGDLAGSVAATTANTAPAALAADEAMSAMTSILEGCDPVLAGLPTGQKAWLVSRTVYNNYKASLKGQDSTYKWTSEDGRNMTINGRDVLLFEGSPVINMNWDTALNADFPTAYPHRIVYTALGNLVVGIDAIASAQSIEGEYNFKDQDYLMRMQFNMGVQYVEGRLTAVAY